MTTILWDAKDRRLYADTRFYKGDEAFEAMAKVRLLRIPAVLKNDPTRWPIHTAIDDVVFGWVHTGAKAPAEAFIDAIARQDEHKLKLDLVFTSYQMAAEAALANETNLFEVILFGKKHLHRFRFDPIVGFHYQQRGLDEPFGLGSGGAIGLAALKRGETGIRAMLEALYCDEMSGGFVELWGFDPDPKEAHGMDFRCLALYPPTLREDIPRYLADDSVMRMPFMMATSKVLDLMEEVAQEKAVLAKTKKKTPRKKTPSKPARKAAAKRDTKTRKPSVKKK